MPARRDPDAVVSALVAPALLTKMSGSDRTLVNGTYWKVKAANCACTEPRRMAGTHLSKTHLNILAITAKRRASSRSSSQREVVSRSRKAPVLLGHHKSGSTPTFHSASNSTSQTSAVSVVTSTNPLLTPATKASSASTTQYALNLAPSTIKPTHLQATPPPPCLLLSPSSKTSE